MKTTQILWCSEEDRETAAELTPCPWIRTLLGGKEAHSTTTEHREQAGNVHRLPV